MRWAALSPALPGELQDDAYVKCCHAAFSGDVRDQGALVGDLFLGDAFWTNVAQELDTRNSYLEDEVVDCQWRLLQLTLERLLAENVDVQTCIAVVQYALQHDWRFAGDASLVASEWPTLEEAETQPAQDIDEFVRRLAHFSLFGI